MQIPESSASKPFRIHIVGRRNSGKTTLVCELVRDLVERGLRVATVKHTHHHHELDTPGKDSYKHREAGAAAVGILSPHMTALFVPSDREQRGEHRYEQFESLFQHCDLILVEGDLQAKAPRIEVWRSTVGERPYAATDPQIMAVISDEKVTDVDCPVWTRTELDLISARILEIRAAAKEPDSREDASSTL